MISRFTFGVIESISTYEAYKAIHYVLPIIVPLNGFAYLSSTYLTVVLTFERYIAICHPYKVNCISRGKTRRFVGSVIIFAMIWNIPKCFAYTWKNGRTVETKMAQSWTFMKVYLLWGHGIVKFVIPLSLLVIFNWFIVREVMKWMKN